MASLRRLAFDDHTFLWRMRWTYDSNGERIVHLTVLHADGGRPRGQPLRARFLARGAAGPAQTTVALPGDVRAAVDLARAHGWDGSRTHWLLPAAGLDRPGLVLSTPTRLREWAGEDPLFIAYFDDTSVAAPVAAELGAVAVPEAAGGVEAQWSGPRCFVLSWERSVSVYTRRVDDLAAALSAAHRHAPGAGASISAQPAQIHGPGSGEIAFSEVLAPNHWIGVANATRYPGARKHDATWVIEDPDGVRIEAYHHHPDQPDRLWAWTTLRACDGTAVTRRFRK
jgi:hypothetical protein